MKKENPKDLPEPLMFIHTVSTKGKTTTPQTYYDSAEAHPPKNKPELAEEKSEDLTDTLEDFNDFEEYLELENEVIETENTVNPDLVERQVPLIDMLRVKLENIIMMYQNGRPVECTIITENEEITCYPYGMEDEYLLVKTEDEEIRILLSDLVDIYIIKF